MKHFENKLIILIWNIFISIASVSVEGLILKTSLKEHTVLLRLCKKYSVYLFWPQSQEEMEMNIKGERFVERRKIWNQYFNLQEKFKLKEGN